ncbi:hypothetical protein [Pseudomonas inefficax]|uniref:hypothetical protein n=1 Tax=Pseudomonas inefficax TaxID=2078786 RepID=UPI002DB7D481|nr:hypothetical protein [Pseudomonas sp. CMAA1741]MEC4559468.1 hypothetical protein [Pseudomonas sp. CMAA1741]
MSDSKKTLHIWLYLHDDTSNMSLISLGDDYLIPLKNELLSFIDLDVRFIIDNTHTPGVTDFNYKIGPEEAVAEWRERLQAHDLITPGLHKYLLVTRDDLDFTTKGIAENEGQVGIASITTYMAIGHEVGHMLGTIHEDAETFFEGGWWKDSYTKSYNPLKGNAHRYSDANRRNIKRHLATLTGES